jgi:hypothetical protein
VRTRYVERALVDIRRRNGDDEVTRGCKVAIHALAWYNAWVCRREDRREAPDWDEAVRFGGDTIGCRRCVEVKVASVKVGGCAVCTQWERRSYRK